jgi:hypothetical protein
MAEPTAPHPSTNAASRLTPPSGFAGAAPEAATTRTDAAATTGRWRTVMTPLRKMMRRSPRH